MPAMLAILLPAILAIIGMIFKNKFLMIIAAVIFLFMAGSLSLLPPYMILVIIAIIIFWAIKGK